MGGQSRHVVVATIALVLAGDLVTFPPHRASGWQRSRAMFAAGFRVTPTSPPRANNHASVNEVRRAEPSPVRVDVRAAELLRAEIVLLREIGHMGDALDGALRDPTYINDRRAMSALNDASRDFKKLTTAFRLMATDLTKIIDTPTSVDRKPPK